MKRFPVIQCLETTQRDLQLGNSAKAEETLQNCYKHLQELVPNDFSNPSSEELQIISHAEKIHIEDAPWISRNGAILLAQEEGLFSRCLNVFGVLALKMCYFDISVSTLEQSVKHVDDTDDEKLNVSLGIAQNNLACVYISKGCFQKAKGSLEAALESFKIIKNSTNGNVVKENIVTVLNNLRQVHQAQRNYIAEQQVRNELFTNLHQVPLSPRIITFVEYNEACISLENRNLRKALNELENLKIFCEIQLPQSEEVVICISLKICLVHLLLGNSSKAAAIINTETLTLPKLIELLNVKMNFLLDFSVTVAETLVDICVNQGNTDVACKMLAYLVTICRERCGANHPIFAAVLRKQGLVFSLMGKIDSSRQCLTDASKIFARAFGAVHPDVLKCEAGLARLESSDGLKENSLLHSQRVLENVEKIFQVSFTEELKEKFEGKFEQRVILIPETDQEEHLKLERLISEFGVEIASVLSQHQPSDLGDSIVSLEEIRNRAKVPVSCYPEEICAKLSFNFLKTGLWFFNLGMVAQSTVFLLLSCTYTEMFHDCLECSDVMLVQVILVLCHLKAMREQRLPIEKHLTNEFKVLRNFIEGRSRQHGKPERKNLFFDEIVNLKVSLALFLRSFTEMEMSEMIEEMHELFSKLQNHHSQKKTNIFLVEEMRFVFFSSKIECLGRVSIHDLIFTTPLAITRKVQNLEERKTSAACQLVLVDQDPFHNDKISKQRQPKNMFRILALTRGKIPFEKFRRFLVYFPVSYEVDIAALNQINDCSVKSIQDTLPPLILRDQKEVTPTQYFVELEPLVSLKSDLLGDLSLLPLILLPAKEAAKTETQPLVFISALKTCEGTVAFTFPDKATSTFLFGQLVKQIFTNLEKLAEITNVGIADDHLVLKIQRPFIGQIVLQCVEHSIKIKTQLMYVTQSPAKREISNEEMPPCSCPIVKMFFGEEMGRCAGGFGIAFEERIEKDWCIASLLPEKAEEMEHKTLTVEGNYKLSHPASLLRMESQRETSHLTLSYEENVLSESCTQTDSLSIPVTFESGTQTDENVENSAAGFVTDVTDTIIGVIPVKDTLTVEQKKPEDITIDPHGIFGNRAEATTLLKESPPDETTAAEKFNWPPFVPGKQGDSKLEKHKEKEHKTVVDGGVLETKDGSNTSKEGQRSLEGRSLHRLNSPSSCGIPLTSGADQCPPCVELPTIEQHAVKVSPTDDWRDNVIRDVTDGTVNREMAGTGEPLHDVTDGRSYINQANISLQDHLCLNSSTTSVKLPLKEGDVVADDSPRHPGGSKNQSTTSCSLNDALKLDEPPNWSRNQGAKPKTNVQGSSDVLSNKKKVNKGDLLERVEESEYFGIRPVFLARHTDDNSISMTSDHGMWNMEDTEERPSDILSRYQRFGFYPDGSYHTPPTCPPPLPLSEDTIYSAGSQGPILGVAPNSTGNVAYLNPNGQRCHGHNLHKEPGYPGYDPSYGDYPSNHNVSVLNLQPPPPLPIIPCDESKYHHAFMNDDCTSRAVQSRSQQAVLTAPSSPSQAGGIGQSAGSVSATLPTQNVVSLQAEASSPTERGIRQQGQQRTERQSDLATTHGESRTVQSGLLNGNSNISDEDSLAALERRVAEACSLVERVLKEREEREKAIRERERRQREERAQREQREWERREERQRNQSGEDTSTGSEEASPSQSAALPESPRWLCEHYQRLCRVKFPCCGRFYPCHRCHNNSDQCGNDNCKAKEAFYIECSICRHQQPINQHAQTCAKCKTKMSAYFCSICKHFTGEDKYPYHCTKCGICRIHKDRSFHCDVCNVCLDKRLQGKHKCRANSGHDECCICLEDAFSGCQILPCSHKVHRECAIAMIQNGVRSCPICRHPLYSQTGGTN